MKVLNWKTANEARLAIAERSRVALYRECSALDDTIRESLIESERDAAVSRRNIALTEYGRLDEEIVELRLNLYLDQPRTRLSRRFYVLTRLIDHEFFDPVRDDLKLLHSWAVTTHSPLAAQIAEMKRNVDEELIATSKFVAPR